MQRCVTYLCIRHDPEPDGAQARISGVLHKLPRLRRARMARRRWFHGLTPPEWRRLAGFGGGLLLLHVLGWGFFLYYSRHNPPLAGVGPLAYNFGLRHAFDADHIAAIDNTTRKFLQDGKRSLGVGFFFSLGHSTIVFSLAAGLALAAKSVNSSLPGFHEYGSYVGAGISGTFLWIIGVLNLLVLLDILRIFRDMRRGSYDRERLEERLLDRGFMNRFFVGRFASRIRASWQMYPLGVLFGLGFDTATEVGLLALAAGMSLMDTVDGAFMSQAYGWAFSNPVRKVYYNITVTSLSVAVALAIGTVELLQVLGFLSGLDFGKLGYGVVGLFVATWATSVLVWKVRRLEERWGTLLDRA